MKKTLFIIALLFMSVAASAQVWDERSSITIETQYQQDFTSGVWDAAKFYEQWDAVQAQIFGSADIASGYLQYEWVSKRILTSKHIYSSPNSIVAEINYEGGSNRGGVVIRANPAKPDHVQEPAQGDPGFNSEGIAFYPSSDGSSMIIQFTGRYVQENTPVTRITVPKPGGVSNLMGRFVLRIEDYGKSVYVFLNDIPFVRIDLGELSGNLYSSGTVFDADMQIAGTFSNMEVEEKGKISICQRNAKLRLYRVEIKSKIQLVQAISFDAIDKKLITDAPFSIVASASSALPLEIEIVSGPATFNEGKVSLTGMPGIVTICANQSGNDNFYPADEVIRKFYVSDPMAGDIIDSQDYVDDWVVTDALGRQLPAYAEAGPKRKDKFVGVFYYIWHGFHGNKVHDITKILPNYPSDPLNANNDAWGNVNAFHFWGEPETGYHRAEDPWVLRRDLQMLSNAHVDFIYIDVTNALTYPATVEALCEVSLQMRAEGIYTPEIVFTTHSKGGITMNKLYDEFYSNPIFTDLWFMWEGKPLILGDANDPELRTEVKDFFTMKFSWAWTNAKNQPNHWQWLDNYPQDYGWSTNARVADQIPVAVASHPNNTKGTSYNKGAQPQVDTHYMTDFTGQGLHFAEQWSRALEVDPTVIMLTQWNEWLAQRFIWEGGSSMYAGRPIKNGDTYFVDAFTEEFNRDMVPMKGGHTDNYYYQMISNIRKFKGMSAPKSFSDSKSITVDGNFDEWTDVSPVFKDPLGDVMHRNFAGYDPTTTYINTSGRNDIIESRVTFDDDNIYFYAKAADQLTSYTDANWMLLFIDSDRNKSTGWEGYDWMINKSPNSPNETSLQKYGNGTWNESSSVSYKHAGNEIEISIPRTRLNILQGKPEFFFKWADNPQHLNDVSAFFVDGEAAPDRRFNYSFNPTISTIDLDENNFNSGFAKIYPNPATNKVRVEMSEYAQVKVYNVCGKLVYSNAHLSERVELDVADWNTGIYMVKIKSSTQVYSQKLIVE